MDSEAGGAEGGGVMAKLYVLFDGRAKGGDTDGAVVMDTAEIELEAVWEGRGMWKGYDAVWYEYDVEGETLANEKMRPDLPPMTY
jgi:hypothetical protein